MTTPSTISLDAELAAMVAAAASWRGISFDEYVRSVLVTASRMDAELAGFVQEGIDSADRGEVVSQEEMEAWFEARHRAVAAE